jgi:hypothetical protein
MIMKPINVITAIVLSGAVFSALAASDYCVKIGTTINANDRLFPSTYGFAFESRLAAEINNTLYWGTELNISLWSYRRNDAYGTPTPYRLTFINPIACLEVIRKSSDNFEIKFVPGIGLYLLTLREADTKNGLISNLCLSVSLDLFFGNLVFSPSAKLLLDDELPSFFAGCTVGFGKFIKY